MSRTYKDAPHRVRLARDRYRKADHHWSCDRDRCDIDDSLLHRTNLPRRVIYSDVRGMELLRAIYPQCAWWESNRRHWDDHGVPRDYRHFYWYGPARAEEVVRFGETIKDYRANGDIDHVELEHGQHRHGAAWDYW